MLHLDWFKKSFHDRLLAVKINPTLTLKMTPLIRQIRKSVLLLTLIVSFFKRSMLMNSVFAIASLVFLYTDVQQKLSKAEKLLVCMANV